MARAQRKTVTGAPAGGAHPRAKRVYRFRIRSQRPSHALTLEAEAHGRQIQQTITSGALGGGALLAGFGIVPALIGMTIGGLIGYLFERSADRPAESFRKV